MLGCPRTGSAAAASTEPAERPAGAAMARRPRPDEPAARRFRELLERERGDAGEPAAPVAAASLGDPTRLARLHAAAMRESPAAPSPAFASSTGAGPPAIPLADVSAAAGPDGAALRFTIDDGFLAGSRMAFLLRGDALELVVEAAGEEALGRLRAREDELRTALAARGLELERFEAERGGREQAGGETDDAPEPAAGRRNRGRRRAEGERGS